MKDKDSDFPDYNKEALDLLRGLGMEILFDHPQDGMACVLAFSTVKRLIAKVREEYGDFR